MTLPLSPNPSIAVKKEAEVKKKVKVLLFFMCFTLDWADHITMEAQLEEMFAAEHVLVAAAEKLSVQLDIVLPPEPKEFHVPGELVSVPVVKLLMAEHMGAVRALLAQVEVFQNAVFSLDAAFVVCACCSRGGPTAVMPCLDCNKPNKVALCAGCINVKFVCASCCLGGLYGCHFCGRKQYYRTLTQKCNVCWCQLDICGYCEKIYKNTMVCLVCRK
jgi:hypothetical protein